MKVLAALMVLIGLVLGEGAVQEFRVYGPESIPFWVAVFVTPASLFFIIAGVLLWLRGRAAKQIVLLAGSGMACATVAATALAVMGVPATLLGLLGGLTAIGWAWRSRTLATNE